MSAPHTVDPDLVDMMRAVFGEHRDRHEPTGGTAVWDPSLWNHLQDLGLARLTGRAEHGGSGAGWFEAAELLRAAAWHGVQVPLAEHDLLAGWLLDAAALAVDDTRRTACVLDADGVATGVPWAAQAERIVLAWRLGDAYHVADVD
ncbi:MAG TPA: acyl-CoA dehydrogenase, partial [Aldersonia sp.]